MMESTNQTETVPRLQKNPKKVAVGLKSAEARKAKQKDAEQKQIDVQQRLAQHEELKAHMREPEQRCDDSAAPTITACTKEPVHGTWGVLDWVPTALLGLGRVAIAWQTLKPTSRPQIQSQIVPTPRETVSIPVGVSTSTRRDPFYMA